MSSPYTSGPAWMLKAGAARARLFPRIGAALIGYRNRISTGLHDPLWVRALALFFQELEDAGVVVIFRPFHEMNGPWFWWGAKPRDSYIAAYRHLRDYLSNTKGLSNILWGYSPNYAWDASAPAADLFYPGDEYVDIVGYDVYYGPDQQELDLTSYGNYDRLVRLGKPMGLFEFGPLPSDGMGCPCWPKAYDYSQLMRDIRDRYPLITFFQAWEWVWQIGSAEFSGQREMADDPWAITLDDAPWSAWRGNVSPTPTLTPAR